MREWSDFWSHLDFSLPIQVMSLPNGLRWKVKTGWYTALVAASLQGTKSGSSFLLELLRKRPSLADVPAEILWGACLNDSADDIIAQSVTLLRAASAAQDAKDLLTFQTQLQHGLSNLRVAWVEWATATRALAAHGPEVEQFIRNPQRILGHEGCNHSRHRSRLWLLLASTSMFAGWSGQLCSAFLQGTPHPHSDESFGRSRAKCMPLGADAQGQLELHQTVRKLYYDHDLASLSTLLNVTWPVTETSTTSCPSEVRRLSARLGEEQFPFAPLEVREHVVNTYLPRKLGNYLGLKQSNLAPKSVIHVPSNYKGDEGKIKGLWEQFQKLGILDLRIDLQPPMPSGFSEHFGDTLWAHWLVQFGANKVSKNSSRATKGLESHGSFASVLMRTDTDFHLEELQRAMEDSFAGQQSVFLFREGQSPPEVQTTNCQPSGENSTNQPPEPDTENKGTEERKESSVGSGNGFELKTLYCDLDGVLADFEGAVRALGVENLRDDDTLWSKIKASDTFFADLEWTVDGKQLWDFLMKLPTVPRILTGLPGGNFGQIAKRQKQRWVKQHLSTEDQPIQTVACMTAEKHTYSGVNQATQTKQIHNIYF